MTMAISGSTTSWRTKAHHHFGEVVERQGERSRAGDQGKGLGLTGVVGRRLRGGREIA